MKSKRLLFTAFLALGIAGQGVAQTLTQTDGVYLISNLTDLETFCSEVNGGVTYSGATVQLTVDIDMSGTYSAETGTSWTPIGSDANSFQGTFDGGGFTISGLYINSSDNGAGFFGINRGTIKNLNVSGEITTSGYNAGGIVGYNEGTVEQCSGSVNLTSTYAQGANNAGGIVGLNYGSGTISKCSNSGNITCENGSYVGGIAGRNMLTVENCYNTGTITAFGYVGGIVGNNAGSVSYCYNIGTVSGTSDFGAIAGVNGGETLTGNCYLEGSVGEGATTQDFNYSYSLGQFASGEVAYALGEAWGQTIGTDTYPVWATADNKVYRVDIFYINTELGETFTFSNSTLNLAAPEAFGKEFSHWTYYGADQTEQTAEMPMALTADVSLTGVYIDKYYDMAGNFVSQAATDVSYSQGELALDNTDGGWYIISGLNDYLTSMSVSGEVNLILNDTIYIPTLQFADTSSILNVYSGASLKGFCTVTKSVSGQANLNIYGGRFILGVSEILERPTITVGKHGVLQANRALLPDITNENWQGVVFAGTEGLVYGQEASPLATIKDGAYTLTVESGKTLTVLSDTLFSGVDITLGATVGSSASVDYEKDQANIAVSLSKTGKFFIGETEQQLGSVYVDSVYRIVDNELSLIAVGQYDFTGSETGYTGAIPVAAENLTSGAETQFRVPIKSGGNTSVSLSCADTVSVYYDPLVLSEISVIWNDLGNIVDMRPADSISVQLLANGLDTVRTITIVNQNEDIWWVDYSTIKVANTDSLGGDTIKYTAQVELEGYDCSSELERTENGNYLYVTMTSVPDTIRIKDDVDFMAVYGYFADPSNVIAKKYNIALENDVSINSSQPMTLPDSCTFTGKGHTLSFNVYNPLFLSIGKGATVENLIVDITPAGNNPSVVAMGNYCGVLASANYGTIKKCGVLADSANLSAYLDTAGIITGYNNGIVESCYVRNISIDMAYYTNNDLALPNVLGSLVGYVGSEGSVTDCYVLNYDAEGIDAIGSVGGGSVSTVFQTAPLTTGTTPSGIGQMVQLADTTAAPEDGMLYYNLKSFVTNFDRPGRWVPYGSSSATSIFCLYPELLMNESDLDVVYDNTNQTAVIVLTDSSNVNSFRTLLEEAPNVYGNALVTLGADIDMGATADTTATLENTQKWTPLGNATAFVGSLDGCGYTISGLRNDTTQTGNTVSLFASIDTSGVVRNLNIEGELIATNDGLAQNDTTFYGIFANYNNGLIENVSFVGTISYEDQLANTLGNVLSCFVAHNDTAGVISNCFYYNTSFVDDEDGNKVCVVLVQHVGSGRGQGVSRKSCTNGRTNKDASVDPEDDPKFQDDFCVFSNDEFANGIVSHWLNYSDKGFTGTYTDKWSQGVRTPVNVTARNKPLRKLIYTIKNGDMAGVLTPTTYANIGSSVSISYDLEPESITVGGDIVPITFADGTATFEVPETATGSPNVEVVITYAVAGIDNTEADATATTITSSGRYISVANLHGDVSVVNLKGETIVSHTNIDGNITIAMPHNGIYIVRAGDATKKILIK